MTKTYSTRVTITDTRIVVETLANNQLLVDTCTRGINENIAIAEFALRHKQQADELLETDTPERIEARKLVNLQNYSTRDIYSSRV